MLISSRISTYPYTWRIDHRQHHLVILTLSGTRGAVTILLCIIISSSYLRSGPAAYVAENHRRAIPRQDFNRLLLILNSSFAFRSYSQIEMRRRAKVILVGELLTDLEYFSQLYSHTAILYHLKKPLQ